MKPYILLENILLDIVYIGFTHKINLEKSTLNIYLLFRCEIYPMFLSD